MKKFEYLHYSIKCKSSTASVIIEKLNILGSNGWEAIQQVGEISSDNGFGRYITFLIKREIVE